MESIEFKVGTNDEPYKVDFEKADMQMLHNICRILDIEGHTNKFTINVNRKIFREVKDLVYTNHWLSQTDLNKYNEIKIKIDGYYLTFKTE